MTGDYIFNNLKWIPSGKGYLVGFRLERRLDAIAEVITIGGFSFGQDAGKAGIVHRFSAHVYALHLENIS